MILGWAHLLILAVALQRLLELFYAQRNSRALIARGGREVGAEHYPLFVVLHLSWLVAIAVLTAPAPPLNIGLLAVFAALQLARVWVIWSLGPYWTTRIITFDEEPLVRRGPYRIVRHPNYLIVAFEVPVLPLALGLPAVALVFGALNLALLAYRIRIEDQTLDPRRRMISSEASQNSP